MLMFFLGNMKHTACIVLSRKRQNGILNHLKVQNNPLIVDQQEKPSLIISKIYDWDTKLKNNWEGWRGRDICHNSSITIRRNLINLNIDSRCFPFASTLIYYSHISTSGYARKGFKGPLKGGEGKGIGPSHFQFN